MATGDASRALAIVHASGGCLILRGRHGPEREGLLAALGDTARLATHADPAQLDGGVDMLASLALGRPVRRPSAAQRWTDRTVVVGGAERLPPPLSAWVARCLDSGTLPRLVLLDEGDSGLAPGLEDRADMIVALGGSAPPDVADASPIEQDALAEALCEAAHTFGIPSLRPPIAALRIARCAAMLRDEPVSADDAGFAARVSLAPRARHFPAPTEAPPETDATPPPDRSESASSDDLTERVIEAVRAALPEGLIEPRAAAAARSSGSVVARRGRPLHGRPGRVRAGRPEGATRLDVAATLLAAAPWQRLRGRGDGRLMIEGGDLRVRRPRPQARAVAIFAVDASGSAALARLAEVKGAVELLLGRSYVRRDEVALVAFRGEAAETLLPPTRSLARAKRELAALPGGGATPLAAGILAALDQAQRAGAAGRAPHLILLTDGGANVARDGTRARDAARADATEAARAVATAGIAATVVDATRRGDPELQALAAAMNGRYVALPRADGAMLAALAR